MDLYDTLIRHYPKYPRNDEVRFQLGLLHLSLSEHGELGAERRKHREEALALFRSVAELSPTSAVAGDALVSLGDEYRVGNQLKPACDALEQASKLNAPGSGLYAKFMLGWCESNRGDETARARLQEVVTLASQATGKNATLKNRALSALVDTYAAREQFEEAKAYYSKTVGEQKAGKYLTSIARLSLVNGRYPFALSAFRQLLHDAPDDARAPTWQAGVVVALDQCGSDAETTEAAKELVKRFGEGSEWRERNRGDQEAVDRAQEAVTAVKQLAGQ